LALALFQSLPSPVSGTAIAADPYATRSFVLVFASIVIAGETLLGCVRSPARLRFLIVLVICIGIASAIFGVLSDPSFSREARAVSELSDPGQGYAQFENRNHFAFLIEMIFGLILGLVIKGENLGAKRLVGGAALLFLIYSFIAANSRGGLISLIAMSVCAVAMIFVPAGSRVRAGHTGRIAPATKRVLAAAGACVLVVAAMIAAIALVGGDTVVTRIERLKDEIAPHDTTKANRKLIWTSTMAAIKDRPFLGSGFGSFRYVFPKYDTSGGSFLAHEAHNDYLEILAGGGLVGLALFVAFGLGVAKESRRNFRSENPLVRSAAFGAAIGMFGVFVHSFVDFGLHIMVNSLIFTALVVIACGDFREGELTAERG
jgi:O-antigen ligase